MTSIKKYKISVIIRTKNEGSEFHEVLRMLRDQKKQDFQLVIVDDNSKDGTDKLAYHYFDSKRVKVVRIPKGQFSHPYSSNLGAQRADGII